MGWMDGFGILAGLLILKQFLRPPIHLGSDVFP